MTHLEGDGLQEIYAHLKGDGFQDTSTTCASKWSTGPGISARALPPRPQSDEHRALVAQRVCTSGPPPARAPPIKKKKKRPDSQNPGEKKKKKERQKEKEKVSNCQRLGQSGFGVCPVLLEACPPCHPGADLEHVHELEQLLEELGDGEEEPGTTMVMRDSDARSEGPTARLCHVSKGG